ISISRSNRCRRSAVANEPARRRFSATTRPVRGCRARKTIPWPPRLISSRTSYSPIRPSEDEGPSSSRTRESHSSSGRSKPNASSGGSAPGSDIPALLRLDLLGDPLPQAHLDPPLHLVDGGLRGVELLRHPRRGHALE